MPVADGPAAQPDPCGTLPRVSESARRISPLHILILSDRDWTHPAAAEAEENLHSQVRQWIEWGHRVTVVAGSYPGATRDEESGPLRIHRTGGRLTVFPRAAWVVMRGLGRDADIVLEVIRGVTFFTPLWLRRPRAALLYYDVRESQRRHRAVAGWLLRKVPLSLLYRGTLFLTVSEEARRELAHHGVPAEEIIAAESGDGSRGDAQTAAAKLVGLEAAFRAGRPALRGALARSETVKAAGLAVAQLAAHGIALVFTVALARLLGADGYGALAALVSTFLILGVPGSALQVATAREVALGRLGSGGDLSATLAHWTARLALACVAATAAALILREPLAALIDVEEEWAAAATVPTGFLWILLCIQRGALQGLHSYFPVGASIVVEAGGRLVIGVLLVILGGEVTGAYLGTPMSMIGASVVLTLVLRRELGHAGREAVRRRLRKLVAGALAPVAGVTLLAVLQNIDVIVVRHQLDDDAAGAYAVAAVAAKAVIWVAVGVGFHLVPEATRRDAEGEDSRPVLLRALALIGIVAVPLLLAFALAPSLILETAFGPEFVGAADALVVLGAAMTMLAAGYLAAQYMLALGRRAFLYVLLAAAVVEPVLLLGGGSDLLTLAALVLAVQIAAAVLTLVLGLRRSPAHQRPVAA